MRTLRAGNVRETRRVPADYELELITRLLVTDGRNADDTNIRCLSNTHTRTRLVEKYGVFTFLADLHTIIVTSAAAVIAAAAAVSSIVTDKYFPRSFIRIPIS